MPTYIDESGDTGSYPSSISRYFCLSAVWVRTTQEAVAIRMAIRGTHGECNLRSDYEYKYSKTGNRSERRRSFFEAVMRHDFRFAFGMIDKSLAQFATYNTADCHRHLATEIAASLRPHYLSAYRKRIAETPYRSPNELITVDNNDDNRFLSAIKDKFQPLGRAEPVPLSLIGKVKFCKSGSEELLQLADMICGACAAELNGEREWYELICDRRI